MKSCVIVPDRGDRPQFFTFCLEQLRRMKKEQHLTDCYLMNWKPSDKEFDLTKRIRFGVEAAKRDGFDTVYIIENDDMYVQNYFELMNIGDFDFIGYSDTTYYNLRNRTWMNQSHPGRSSLYCTGFKLEAVSDFLWPADHHLWLDLRLWDHARDKGKRVKLMTGNPNIGIKHSIGLTAGKAHRMTMANHDPGMEFLKSRVEDYQFEFYSKLKLS